MFHVYKFLNKEEEVIYVGKTKNFKQRLNSHLKTKRWKNSIFEVLVAECITHSDMNLYEIYYISKHKPLHNKDCKEDDDITFNMKELNFLPYTEVDFKQSETSGIDVSLKYVKLREIFQGSEKTTISLFYSLVHYISSDGSNKLTKHFLKNKWYAELNISKNSFEKHLSILEKLNLAKFVRNEGMYINPKYVYFSNKKIKETTLQLFIKKEND